MKPKILIADDDPMLVSLLMEYLESQSWDVIATCSGQEACWILKHEEISAAAIDLKMPDRNGLEILCWMQKQDISVPVIIFSGVFCSDNVVKLIEAGADKLVSKSEGVKELIKALKRYVPGPEDWKTRLDLFLCNSYVNPEFSLGHVLKHFRISKTYASSLFKKHFGKPFKQKLRELRVKKAKKMIENSDWGFEKIAEQSGFKSYKRLGEAFKIVEGRSPRDYAKCVRLRVF